MDEAARNAFRARWRERIEGDPTKVRLYKDIGAGIATAGIEYYLPLFFDETATVFDYLGARGDAGAARRGRRGAAALLGRHARAPSLPPARPRAADPAARGAVPEARGVLRRLRRARAAGAARQGDDAAPWATALPDLSVDRGAPEPLKRLQGHVARDAAPRPDRRRERRPAREPARAAARQPHRAAERRHAGRVRGRRRALRDRRRAARARLRRRDATRGGDDATTIEFVTETELFAMAPGARRRRTPGADQRRQRADQGPLRAEGRRPGRARQPRHRPLPRPDDDRPRRRRGRGRRVPAPRVRRQGDALRAGRAAAPDRALHRRQRRGSAAAQARLGPVGQGAAQGRRAGARHRRRAAEPLRAPRRARGLRVPLPAARLRGLRGQLRLRGDARPARRDPRRDPGHGLAAADGPARLRRRRLRQDRGRAARRLRRRQRRQAGRDPGADDAARRAALPEHRRPLRQVAGEGRRAVALPLAEGGEGGARRARRRHGRHRRRHAQAALEPTSSSSASACS